MATKEDQETLRLLVQHVARGFYESKFTIVMDQLARNPVLKDDDLAGKMGLQSKELNKLMAVVLNDRLVQVFRQNELKEGAQRAVAKQYYYIDYELFCNVVKWRVAEMRRLIDSTLRNELDNKGYICPQCKKSYTPLEVDKLVDFVRGAFICEICQGEVVDNEDAETVRGSKDRMQRFNHSMRFVREGLRKSESMVLPAFDVALWIKNNPSEADKAKMLSGGLKIAGANGDVKADDDYGIEMSMDKDEATRRAERDAEAKARRAQNAMPAWHMKSTISGDLTALGIAENERAEGARRDESSSNDDLLKGFGIVGGGPRGSQDMGIGASVQHDVKPSIDVESDYYDQYYASLAAQQAAVSAPMTPMPTPMPEFEDEEEDIKPSVQYLDSLNSYRKRSRSAEDDGRAAKKIAKADPFPVYVAPPEPMAMEGEETFMPAESGPPQDNPMVMVNGAPMSFSTVSEDDQEMMTPEEYEAYYAVVQEMG